jgi:hypothetical protein
MVVLQLSGWVGSKSSTSVKETCMLWLRYFYGCVVIILPTTILLYAVAIKANEVQKHKVRV